MNSTTLQEAMQAIAALNSKLLDGMMRPLTEGGTTPDVGELMRSLSAGVITDGGNWLEQQNHYYEQQMTLWREIATVSAQEPLSEAPADIGDRRFAAPEWKLPYFRYLAQSYLLATGWLDDTVSRSRLEPAAQRRLQFIVRQFADAMCPANFAWSNPEALKRAAETEGASLVQGLRNLTADLDRGMVSMTNPAAFEVGRNLAITPGAVVLENDFLQLIQYRPQTAEVHERPLLIVPPFINKFYVLDLQPENSFVNHAVRQGHTVFMVSWRNMPARMGTARWDDYLEQGLFPAMDAICDITTSRHINALGFCVGGTLLATAAAVLRARGDRRIASLTLLATLLDYTDTGELSVFIDEAYVKKREADFAQGGLLHGRELAITFASLRANDLIWNNVVNNYLKGGQPPAFDLLHWNSDSTNLPGVMYAWYVRNMYLENNLRLPGHLQLCGVPVDLGCIDAPAYLVGTKEDHIVPWKSAFSGAALLGGKIEFVLGASGHIAGIINPAIRNRRCYWTAKLPAGNPEHWLESAVRHNGSWWVHWHRWLSRRGGRKMSARTALGSARHREIEPAPGRYVVEGTD